MDYRDFLSLSRDRFSRIDIAHVNLACCVGLPGFERVDVVACMRTLDHWTNVVRDWTANAFVPRFLTNPAFYDNSETVFRLSSIHIALMKHCGLRYNPDKIGLPNDGPWDLDDICIAPILEGRGGTCATLPIIYASIGRRLGYPIRLAHTKGHEFCRWDDPRTGEYVNLDGGGKGNVHPDDYYRTVWPYPFDQKEERIFGYLRSLTPREELAKFIGRRGYVWETLGEYSRAIDEFDMARRLNAPYPGYGMRQLRVGDLWLARIHERHPVWQPASPSSPAVFHGPRRWPGMSWDWEYALLQMEEMDSRATASVEAADCRHVAIHT